MPHRLGLIVLTAGALLALLTSCATGESPDQSSSGTSGAVPLTVESLTRELTPSTSALAGRTECGAQSELPGSTVVAVGVSCTEGHELLSRYYRDPRTQRGDHGAQLGEWGCNIYGAAEVERLGYVVKCARPDGAAVMIVPAGATSAPTSASGACTASIQGRGGTIAIVSGSITCAAAQRIIAQRDGAIGYFDGPGTTWACGSQGTPPDAAYFCYPTDKSARFEWTPN